jgi:hypothetical protein
MYTAGITQPVIIGWTIINEAIKIELVIIKRRRGDNFFDSFV